MFDRVFSNNIPLTCNLPHVSTMKDWAIQTPEVKQYRRDRHLAYASAIRSGDEDAIKEAAKKFAAEIVNMDIDLMLYAQNVVSSLFEIVPVRNGNIPAYTTWKHDTVSIIRMADRGLAPSVTLFKSGTMYFPQLYIMSTERLYQNRQSIFSGEVAPDDSLSRMAEYQMARTMESDIWTLLAAAIGDWTSIVDQVWIYDTDIMNLPTTNDYDFSTEGGLTKGLFQKILAAVDLIPSRVRPNEPVKIRNMFVPHVSAKDLRTWVSVVSATGDASQTISPTLQARMEQSSAGIDSLWGTNLGMRTVNTPMGTTSADFAKYLWVFFDEPIGRLYVAPDQDINMPLTDKLPYETGIQISKVVGMEIPAFWRPNFMKVQFAT